MPNAATGDAALYDALGIKDAENVESHRSRSAVNLNKSWQAARTTLGENPNGAHGSSKVLPEALAANGDASAKPYRGVGHSDPRESSNGWQEPESDASNTSRNEWTQVKRKGSLHSKKKRRNENNVSAEEMDSPSSLKDIDRGKVSKLSQDKLLELTSSPDALPLQSPKSVPEGTPSARNRAASTNLVAALEANDGAERLLQTNGIRSEFSPRVHEDIPPQSPSLPYGRSTLSDRPGLHNRASSSPLMKRKLSNTKANGITPISIPKTRAGRSVFESTQARDAKADSKPSRPEDLLTSPLTHNIPLPPLSVPTHLHLELSSHRPSPLYLYRSSDSDVPYEPTHIKLERLQNFLLLPPQLEQVLWFGALACFDAWLYTFTILPIRFGKATSNLVCSLLLNIWAEFTFVTFFIYAGAGRMWKRSTIKRISFAQEATNLNSKTPEQAKAKNRMPSPAGRSEMRSYESTAGARVPQQESSRARTSKGHRRTRSEPSTLLPVEKADILKGLLIVISCYILMYFDASMMYHNIRGQAAIKLYVIYNALEVFDRLLSALGQDILECLFAKETLDRKPNGRSKILRPLWLFLLALVYNIVHSTALFYQVITLNVAVNSYSNALLTLLMSNQFVEIKSTVFKKIEKENLFQMTCADVVERFQLWLMLIIIAARNIVETGGLSNASGSSTGNFEYSPSLLPHSFTLLPDWVGQVMSPFFFVLGTETIVDWVKHAYITKFNAVKPNIYGRFLDVLAKDYYSNAFTDPNLTRRVGLPTIPLSCLFIRASVQTYHMFLATHASAPPSPSSSTSLTEDYASPESTPAITAAIQHIDRLFKRAIFGTDPATPEPPINIPYLSSLNAYLPSLDTILTHITTLVFFTLLFLVLLVLKILLGMALLSFARNRYAGMKSREQEPSHVDSKRFGGWGMVETGDERRKWIYEDDAEGLRKTRDRERDSREKEARGGGKGLSGVERYTMVAKRIW